MAEAAPGIGVEGPVVEQHQLQQAEQGQQLQPPVLNDNLTISAPTTAAPVPSPGDPQGDKDKRIVTPVTVQKKLKVLEFWNMRRRGIKASQKKIALECGVGKTSVSRLLKKFDHAASDKERSQIARNPTQVGRPALFETSDMAYLAKRVQDAAESGSPLPRSVLTEEVTKTIGYAPSKRTIRRISQKILSKTPNPLTGVVSMEEIPQEPPNTSLVSFRRS